MLRTHVHAALPSAAPSLCTQPSDSESCADCWSANSRTRTPCAVRRFTLASWHLIKSRKPNNPLHLDGPIASCIVAVEAPAVRLSYRCGRRAPSMLCQDSTRSGPSWYGTPFSRTNNGRSPKRSSASYALCGRQRSWRFVAVLGPPSANGTTWWNSRKLRSAQRPPAPTKAHCPPSRSQTFRFTSAGT